MRNWNYLWINGQQKEIRESIPVLNPRNEKIIGHVPSANSETVDEAIQAATTAFFNWSAHSSDERTVYLEKWANLIEENEASLAELLSLEQGKPLHEALGEMKGTCVIIRWFAQEGKRIYGEVLPASKQNQQLMILQKPVGPVGLITPANVPAAILANKVAPALASGCTFVLKPADQTPMIGLALIELLIKTGIPKGVANILTGNGVEIGQQLVADPRLKKIAFTGSTVVGKKIAAQASNSIKRLMLELGGNAPAIVFEDANVEDAVSKIISNKFENAGQVCNGINVVYVHESIKNKVVKLLKEKIGDLSFNTDSNTQGTIGPLIDKSYISRVEEIVKDTKDKGATVLIGGSKSNTTETTKGYYFEPTLIDDVTQEMKITQEEVFGPVLPVSTFKSEEEILEVCNNITNALAAYIFTSDIKKINVMMNQLEFGNIGINETSLAYPQAPFGGLKESGIGRVGGRRGLEEYLELRYIALSTT